MPPPPEKMMHMPLLLLIVLEILAVWAWPASAYFLYMGLTWRSMQLNAYAETFQNGKLQEVMLFNGAVALGAAVGASWLIWRYYQSRREWARRYFEFNDVQLRACQNARGDWLLYWPDVLQAAEMHTPAMQQRVTAALLGQGGLHGAAPDYYISPPALWWWLLRKKDRLGIRFTQYLAQTPQFALDEESIWRMQAELAESEAKQQPEAAPESAPAADAPPTDVDWR